MSVWFTVTPLLCGEALLGLVLFPPPWPGRAGWNRRPFVGGLAAVREGLTPSSWAQGRRAGTPESADLGRTLESPEVSLQGWVGRRQGRPCCSSVPVSVAWRPGRCCHPAVGTPELSVPHRAVLSCWPGWLLSSFLAPRCAEPGPALCRLPGP